MKTKKLNHVIDWQDEDNGIDYVLDIEIAVTQSTPSEMLGIENGSNNYPRLYITDVDYSAEIVTHNENAPDTYTQINHTTRLDDAVQSIVENLDLIDLI